MIEEIQLINKESDNNIDRELPLFLNEIELSLLKSIVRMDKFTEFMQILYPKDNIHALYYFEKCYRCLYNDLITLENDNRDFKLINKLREYINNIKNIYIKVNYLLTKYRENDPFFKKNLLLDLNKFYINNLNVINTTISFVYQLGKFTKSYDPDVYAGIQQ